VIRRVSANHKSFRAIEFAPHFNLVLAERTSESTERDSRNGLGKSLLIEILHFCLGARGSKGHGVVVDALDEWEFRVDVLHGHQDFAFTRAVADAKRKWIYIDSPTDAWPLKPEVHEARERVNVPTLNRLLGRVFFGLTEEIEDTKWGPTYRSLVSYLVRRGPDGFLDPFTHDRNQQEWDKQVNVGYHLNLSWRDAAAAQELRGQKKVIDQLSKVMKEGTLPSYLGSEGALEAERVALQAQIAQRLERLSTFRVREDYWDIQDEAGRLVEVAHRLVNENMRDRRYIDLYSDRLEVERSTLVTTEEVERLFKEATVTLPEQVVRRLDEVNAFHEAVVENRRAYLEGEVERLRAATVEREQSIAAIDDRRTDLMRVLESTGALEEYTQLQELLVEIRGRLRDVEARLERLKEVTAAKAEWERRKATALQNARTRYAELRTERDRAIAFFNSNTQALYETAGRLIIDVDESGFNLSIDIDRSDSHGVSNMKIFCFDLMLMQLWSERGGGPGVLVHDSALFDGVDERQIAAALELAQSESERLGFQYICTMNSDDLPRAELGDGSPVLNGVTIELHDRDASGTLLGLKF
jgi:uncharacterized protein YydD (DUF2326 family)